MNRLLAAVAVAVVGCGPGGGGGDIAPDEPPFHSGSGTVEQITVTPGQFIDIHYWAAVHGTSCNNGQYGADGALLTIQWSPGAGQDWAGLSGSFPWGEHEAGFTAPAGATSASVGWATFCGTEMAIQLVH